MSTFAEHRSGEEHDVAVIEDARVTAWRLEQFRALGFDDDDALLLALSACDLQSARTLMATGCSTRLALRILL